MKKLTLLFLLATLTVFVACNKDDGGFKNQILIDDTDLGEYAGYYDDFGMSCLTGIFRAEGACATHQATAFMLTDGTYGEEDSGPSEYSYYVMITLYSPGESFENGVYKIENNVYDTDYTGQKIGSFSDFEFPGEFDGCCISSVEGDVIVSGKHPNLTMKFDLKVGYYQYAQGVRQDEGINAYVDVTGQYRGEFLERMMGR